MQREQKQREKTMLRQRLERDITHGGRCWRKALEQADFLPVKRATDERPPPGFENVIPFSDDCFDLEDEQFHVFWGKCEKQKM